MKDNINNTPTISVLMSVYNEQESWLREAIESILNQTYADFEFIIILDNPENEMIKKIIQEYIETDKRIIFLENKENLGSGPSKNRGLKIARGKYIAIMDADDISLPNRFEEQLKFMENNPKIDLLGAYLYRIDENNNIIGFYKYPTDPIKLVKLAKFRCLIQHGTWFVKKKVYLELNGYRDILAAEDYDFLLKVVDKNFLTSNLPIALYKYRVRNNQVSQQNSLIQLKMIFYILKLHKYRLKTGQDDFSQENLSKALKSSKLETWFYHKADGLYIKARELKDKKRLISASLLVIMGFILSPYWMSKRIYRAFFGLEKVQNIYLKYFNKKTNSHSSEK